MNFEEIMEEVREYNPVKMVDGIVKNPDEQAIDTGYERVTLWGETDIRNDILKTIALGAFTAGCAYFKLMHAYLYIPIGLACLCGVCYKLGVYRGRTEE